MCLILDDKVVHTSDEDITCYKIVARIKRNNRRKCYYSASVEQYISSCAELNDVPVVAKRWGSKEEIKEDDFINGVTICGWDMFAKKTNATICEGAIHSYANLDDAICDQKKYIDSYNAQKTFYSSCMFEEKEYFVVKCIIPKGTPYYIGYKYPGIITANIKNYASRELIYKSIIED